MKLLFLDDSFVRHSWHLGYGGFAIDSSALKSLTAGLLVLRSQFGLPLSTEIKWSPPPGHPIRTRLKGQRHELYAGVIELLRTHSARVLCAVHALRECYGVNLHGWSRERAVRWAAGQQLRFLAERFARPYLEQANEDGLIVCDQYDSRGAEDELASGFAVDLMAGTGYTKLERIPHVALMTNSAHSPAIQVADTIVGIVTSAVSRGQYGVALFSNVAPLFLWNPAILSSLPSSAISGFGLKVFPSALEARVRELCADLDRTHIVSGSVWKVREPISEQPGTSVTQ